MKKEIIKMTTITKKGKITEQIICDVCGKTIADVNKPKVKYWELTTHHTDWGVDSVDSYENFDLCSHDCIKTKLEEYIENCNRSDTLEFDLEQAKSNINTSALKGDSNAD